MKVKCTYCRSIIEFDEKEYHPGDVVAVECRRCGEEVSVTIPPKDDEAAPKKPAVKVTRKEVSKEVEKPEVVESEVSQPSLSQPAITLDNEVKNEITQPAKPRRKRSAKTTGSPVPEVTLSDENKVDSSMLKFEKLELKPQEEPATTPPPVPRPRRKTTTTRKTTSQSTPNNTNRSTGQRRPTSNNQKPPTTISTLGCILWIVFIVLGVIASIWFFRSCSDSDRDAEAMADSAVVEEVAYVEDEPEVTLSYENPEEIDTVYYDSMMVEESIIPADTIVSVGGEQMEEAEPSQASYMMGFHSGKNSFVGDMIHTDGRRFPFTLEFDYFPEDNKISDVVYVNTTSSTKLKLETTEFTHSMVRFEGKDGGKKFIIQFSNTQPYSGDAWWGDFHQNIELNLK